MTGPYNPLDKINLGKSVAGALLLQPVSPLEGTSGLIGAGVYAIYYTGPFPAYAPICVANKDGGFRQPIYVGKAIPEGSRKGGLTFDASQGPALRKRLSQHAASIRETDNLDVAHFHFRCLVVDDVWIPLGEAMMIEEFQPIWNRVIDGFGINTPGAGREKQKRSAWDVLHPGRKRAVNLSPNASTAAQITEKLHEFFAGKAVPLIPENEATDPGDAEE